MLRGGDSGIRGRIIVHLLEVINRKIKNQVLLREVQAFSMVGGLEATLLEMLLEAIMEVTWLMVV